MYHVPMTYNWPGVNIFIGADTHLKHRFALDKDIARVYDAQHNLVAEAELDRMKKTASYSYLFEMKDGSEWRVVKRSGKCCSRINW